MFQICIDSDDINLEKTPPQSPLMHQGKHALILESKLLQKKPQAVCRYRGFAHDTVQLLLAVILVHMLGPRNGYSYFFSVGEKIMNRPSAYCTSE